MESAIVDNHVKLMILCNPHNPGGRVWTKRGAANNWVDLSKTSCSRGQR